MELSFFKKKCTGIDIGSKNIKVVLLKFTSKGKFALKYCKLLNIPDHLVPLDTLPENRTPFIVESIKGIFSENKSLPKTVGICVSGSSVVVRYAKLPMMTKEELSKSISIEAEPFVPFPINEVYLSFDIIGQVMEEGMRKNEVVIVAAKKDFVDSKIDILTQCGLTPQYIDVDIFALERVLRYNYEIDNDIVCVANIGANITNIGIIENGTTKVCRDLNLGMEYIINEIKKTRQLEVQDVINYIRNDGLIISEEEKERYLVENKKIELAISKDLTMLLKEFVSELRKLIEFYYFQRGEQKPLTKIFLSGGGCVIKNISEYFSSELKIPAEILDPFKNIADAEDIPQEIRPLYSVAVGIAMKSYW